MRENYLAVAEAPVCIVPYEAWFTDPTAILDRLAAQTSAPTRLDDPELTAAVVDVIDAGLRHDNAAGTLRLSYITPGFYAQLLVSAEAGRLTETTIRLAQHFVGFERLTTPAQKEFAQVRTSLEEAVKQLAIMRATPVMAG